MASYIGHTRRQSAGCVEVYVTERDAQSCKRNIAETASENDNESFY